jgi:hypothetical protein
MSQVKYALYAKALASSVHSFSGAVGAGISKRLMTVLPLAQVTRAMKPALALAGS